MRNLNHLAAILLLCCLLCPLSLNAEKWTAETLPMVYLQDARRHVCNPDGVLDEATVSSTDSLLTALEKDYEDVRQKILGAMQRSHLNGF